MATSMPKQDANVLVRGSLTSAYDSEVTCSEPLGIKRDSINIQFGFTITEDTKGEPETPSISFLSRSYIQVDLHKTVLISGIVTQDSPQSASRVTHFRVAFSTDCITFANVTDRHGVAQEYYGNAFSNTTTTVMFDHVFNARCVRVVPTQRIGEDTDMRFELLGCSPDHCKGFITPRSTEFPSRELRKIMFDKEKIITSMRITLTSPATKQTPAFKVVYARACNYEMGQFVKENAHPKHFKIPFGESSLALDVPGLPIRSQCIAVLTHWETGHDQKSGHHRAGNPLFNMETDGYQVTFEGCNALPPHEPIDSCGNTHIVKHGVRKRVVGGSSLLPGEWPWLVSMHFLKTPKYTDLPWQSQNCGASLIHPQWLLTAAHCVSDVLHEGSSDTNNWRVVLGEHVQGREEGTEQNLTVDKIVTHPMYMQEPEDTLRNDIALVKLSSPAHMSEYVNTICIEPNYTAPVHNYCVTAGWGHLVEGSFFAAEMPHHASVQIVPTSVCIDRYNLPEGDKLAIDASVICAATEGRDSCQGDSGGPLACFHDGHWTQVGVVAGGLGCANPQYPGVYTRVNFYYDWIATVIEAN
ncbi:uncharacterized protein LOC127852679 [Dreissena polymorpha]|uniref:Uncharacterized protein n=1 Tax=Dreissena polymorpha TaxID=45954 RepID=A0A9D4CQV5_DREPO|nr:uncharacterized protein LOC127852679 [Dreissena polymorpha]KAH3729979.1 hypothetical protein DPMN_055957 [Dreissena polymorpha]